MCQIQYNYMNEEIQAGTTGLQYAAAKGLAVAVMEPLLGGRLVNPPPSVRELWDSTTKGWSPADWALHWLWNKPEVSVALSGMSTMEQVHQNVAAAERSRVGSLTEEDLALIRRVRDKHNELCPTPCTQCRYCMPCPNGVDIPHNLGALNSAAMYDAYSDERRRYQHMPEEARASACIECRQCEDLCPQSIEISAWMSVVHEVLGEGRAYEACIHP